MRLFKRGKTMGRLVRDTLFRVRDRFMLCANIIVCHGENARIAGALPHIQFPPCGMTFHTYNHCSNKHYYESGLAHADFIMGIIRRFKQEPDLVVCEWGCGPARIIQHLKTGDGGIATLIGTDYNHDSVAWCRKAFPHITFLGNQLEPPLQMKDNSVDVVYCCAVFTHLSEGMHYAWMAEILRILKPGGLFIGSFHGDNLKDRLLPEELVRYAGGEIVVRGGVREGTKNYVAFHSDSYVKNRVLVNFDNITKLDDAPFLQSVWCATAPAA